MKLRQKEFCHNCNQHVIFEFEDVEGQQIIDCPNCGHKHYREIDSGTILDIRLDQMEGRGQYAPGRAMRIAVMPEMPTILDAYSDVPSMPPPCMTREVVGMTEDGKAIVKPIEGEKVEARVTERRWGQDPNQRRT